MRLCNFSDCSLNRINSLLIDSKSYFQGLPSEYINFSSIREALNLNLRFQVALGSYSFTVEFESNYYINPKTSLTDIFGLFSRLSSFGFNPQGNKPTFTPSNILDILSPVCPDILAKRASNSFRNLDTNKSDLNKTVSISVNTEEFNFQRTYIFTSRTFNTYQLEKLQIYIYFLKCSVMCCIYL